MSLISLRTDEMEAFIDPPCHPAAHQLDRPAELGETHGRTGCAVAMGPCAIDDEKDVEGVVGEFAANDLAVRQADRRRHMASLEGVVAANVKEDEIPLSAGDCGMNVPAVGLEAEFSLEAGLRKVGRRGGDFGDNGHEELLVAGPQ